MSQRTDEENIGQHEATRKEEDKMSGMDEMMEAMIGNMSKEERQDMMGTMMEKFFADMTVEDKQKMMEQMMPKMMEGINMMEMMPRMMMGMMGGGQGGSEDSGGMMGMMSQMMGGGQGMGMTMMPHMMTQMMPHCLNVMLPSIPKEERVDFVLNMITTLIEQGSVGMSEEERSEFIARVLEKVTS